MEKTIGDVISWEENELKSLMTKEHIVCSQCQHEQHCEECRYLKHKKNLIDLFMFYLHEYDQDH